MPCKIIVSLFVLLLFTNQTCLAKDKNFFWEFGLYNGGDEIPTKELNPQHVSTVNAGELASVSLGAVFHLSNSFSFSPSLGIKYNSNGPDFFNYDEIRWKIYVLSLPLAYRADDWQFVIGLVYHYKPTLTLISDKYREEWAFDDSVGTTIGFNYFYNSDASIGLQYTDIEYTMTRIGHINGSNYGLIWRIFFAL